MNETELSKRDLKMALIALVGPDVAEPEMMTALQNVLGSRGERHTNIRLGLVLNYLEDWRKEHANATDEQFQAATVRYAAFAKNYEGLFKVFQGGMKLHRLMQRADLGTDL